MDNNTVDWGKYLTNARNTAGAVKAPEKKKTGGVGGFIQRNLSTIGSIALPTIADIATGGLALPLNVALGAAGGAIGKAGQNALEHKSIASDVGGSAVAGGAGEFGGQLLGKGLGILGKVASKPIERGVADIAEQKVAQEAISRAEPFANVPKNVREGNNLNGVMDFFKHTLGMDTSPKALKSAANLVTGENGVVSGTMRQILGDVGHVPTSGVMDATKAALIQEAGNLGEAELKGSAASGTLREVRDMVQNKLFKGGGDISAAGTADANDVLDTIQALEKKIQNQPHTDAGISRANVFKAAKGSLEDGLYNSGGLNAAVKNYRLGNDDINEIRAAVEEIGGNSALADHIIEGINHASTGQELRSLQKPFVDASMLAQGAEKAAGGALPRSTGGAGSNPRGDYYTMREAAGALGGNPLAALPLLAKPGIKEGAVKVGEKVIGGANKVENAVPGGTSTLFSRLVGQSASHANNPVDALGATDPSQSFDSFSQNPIAEQPPVDTSPYSQEALLQDIQRDPKNTSQYLSLFSALNPSRSANTIKPSSQQVGVAQSGEQSLEQLASELQSDPSVLQRTAIPGGGLPIVGGVLNRLAGTGKYKATANNTLDALARLRTGAAMSKNEEKFYQSLLPQAGDDQQTIAYKLQQLQQAFAPYASQTIGAGATN